MELIIIGFVLLLILGVILLLCYFICTKGGAIGRVVISLLGIFIWYHIYLAFFPSDDFYRHDFKKVTGLAFPASGKILNQYASFPDLHGDYDSCALIQVSTLDYEKLKENFQPTNATESADYTGGCDGASNWGPIDLGDRYFQSIKKSGGEIKAWGLLKEKNLVYIEYTSR